MSVKTVNWPDAPITGRWHEEQAVTLAGANNRVYKRGEVLSKAADGKWYKWARETALAAADSNGNRGTLLDAVAIVAATKSYTFALKYRNIIPGTVLIKSAADTDNSHRYADADSPHGALSGVEADGQRGSIDYRAGLVHILWESNTEVDDVLASYSYGDQDGKTYPAGILIDQEVKASSDATGTVAIIGEVVKDQLVWPANTSDAEKTRALAHLEDYHKIYAV